MTNQPYPPPWSPQPGPRQGQYPANGPGYPGQHRPGTQGVDWRYATQQQYRAPQDPYAPVDRTRAMPIPQAKPQKRSRAGFLTVGALSIALVSAGIGGGVATLVRPERPPVATSMSGAASKSPVTP